MYSPSSLSLCRTFHRAIAMLCLGACAISVNAEILYQENFNNDKGRNLSLSRYAWQGCASSKATDVSEDTTLMLVAPTPGNPATPKGYLAFVVPEGTYLASCEFPKVDATGAKITWRMGNSHKTGQVRLLVRSGSQWFVSNEAFYNSDYDAGKFAEADPAKITFSVTLNANAWKRLIFKPGESLLIGPAATLPSVNLEGIGFLVENPGARVVVRIDSVLLENARR